MCKNINCPKDKLGFSKVQGFKIETILVDNPHLACQVGEQGATSKDFPCSLGKPGLVLGDVSGFGRPGGAGVCPPIIEVRGSTWSHTKSKIPIP
jgi:hypothetical protein